MVRVGSIIGFYMFPLLEAFTGLYNTILIISIFPLVMFFITFVLKYDPIQKNADDEDFVKSIEFLF